MQLVVNGNKLTLTSFWQYNNVPKRTTFTTASGEITFNVTGLPDGAVVRRATFTAQLSNPPHKPTIATIYARDVRNDVGSSVSIRVDVRSNRTVTVAVQYKVGDVPYADTAMHNESLTVGTTENPPTLTIVYDMDEYTEAPEEPRLVLDPVRTVKLFAPTETDFTTNGLCILSPTECIVTEEAGGAYELQMSHPIDEHGKWEMLREDYIIEAPIPPMYIPEVTMPPWETWRTKNQTDLYTTLPSYTKAKNGVEAVQANPSMYAWHENTPYAAGVYVTYQGYIYRAVKANSNVRPQFDDDPEMHYSWTVVAKVQGSGTTTEDPTKPQYKPGVIGETLAQGELVYKIADYSSTWMQVRSLRGVTGWVKIADCEAVGAEVEVTEPARILYTQLFRVYEISGEEDEHAITVLARHISYDLQKNVLYDLQLEECEPASAAANVMGSMINEDEIAIKHSNPRMVNGEWVQMQEAEKRKVICDMTEPLVSCEWSYQNPVQALLDPEDGLAGKTRAKVLRDNLDLYIVNNFSPRVAPTIRYGVNLIGVTWSRNSEDVITRVIPRAQNDEGKYIYLDNLYVDSDAIDEYAVISTEVLDSKYKVGQKIKHLDGQEITLSLSDVMERMLSEAEDRFYVDHCDAVTVALDVEFILLGDTEEYRQYRNLQRLQIYDMVTIETGVGRLTTKAQVSGYEWDCIAGRYKSISIGRVFKQARRALPGYRLASGAITYSKLAPDLISFIKGAE